MWEGVFVSIFIVLVIAFVFVCAAYSAANKVVKELGRQLHAEKNSHWLTFSELQDTRLELSAEVQHRRQRESGK